MVISLEFFGFFVFGLLFYELFFDYFYGQVQYQCKDGQYDDVGKDGVDVEVVFGLQDQVVYVVC